MDIQVGEHAVDYSQIQAKDKLSELQLRIRQLLDQVEQITKEQNYQKVNAQCIVVRCTLVYREKGQFVDVRHRYCSKKRLKIFVSY